MKYCTYCGKENREEARFCGHCGQAFGTDTSQPQAPETRRNPFSKMKIFVLCVVVILFIYPLFTSLFHSSPAARRTLEQKGIPFTQGQFFREVESGNTEAVALFLAAGMDPKTEGFMGTTALGIAVSKGHLDTVQVLLSNGADPNQETFGGRTLLMSAASEGHTDIVRALLDKGAYVNAKGPLGITALKLATRGRHADTVQLLKQAGARE
jgi:hypothetical protein